MKAEIGDEVGLHYDTDEEVRVGEFIETRTGRSYRVTAARKQLIGIYAGRFHLRCVVVKGAEKAKARKKGVRVHPLFWYPRGV